jgi:tetraacyldisaccharide 4'-kinase
MYSPPLILKPVLFFPGIVYEALVRLRNRAYSSGMLRQQHLPGPVISVGNLTLGGTGKTPLVIFIAGMLIRLGYPTALLTRGYGRHWSNHTCILQPGSDIPTSVSAFGDEPALIRRALPGLWMGIAKDRHSVGLKLSALQPGAIFILDDGFQHRKLHRDLDLVIIDPMQPFVTNSVFPRGSLREPLQGMRRSQLVLINGISPAISGAETERMVRTVHPDAKIFHCLQRIDRLVPLTDWKNAKASTAAEPPGKSAFLVAAIGNPHRLRKDVEQAGIEVRGTRFYRDHHLLDLNEWLICAREARNKKASFILTTEKDAIKVSQGPDFPLFVALQSTSIAEADEFEAILKLAIGGVR